MSTIIALAMAEIASAFPTAGGLYYWASKLGSPGWGWATGWFNLIGQIAVTASIGYGLATFATVLFDYWFNYANRMNDWFGFSYNTSVYVLYAIFLIATALINMFHVSITAMLNTISAYWHMAGVAFIVLVLIIVPNHHQSFSFVFTGTVNNSGYGARRTTSRARRSGSCSASASLLAQYTITGFDASAHIAEETHAGLAHGGRRDVHVRRRRRSSSAGSSCSPSPSRSRARRGRSTTSGRSCHGSGRSR